MESKSLKDIAKIKESYNQSLIWYSFMLSSWQIYTFVLYCYYWVITVGEQIRHKL